MKGKIPLFMLSILLVALFIAGCTKETDIIIVPTDNNEPTEVVEFIEENTFFKVMKKDLLYYYVVYDAKGVVVATGGPTAKIPDIVMVDDVLIRITTQGGTGKATETSYYCDIETGKISENYDSVFDQENGLVVYVLNGKVIIKSIFDDSFYREIASFQHPFSRVAFPFENITFINNGSGVMITYLTGIDYKEVSEEFALVTGTQGDGSLV